MVDGPFVEEVIEQRWAWVIINHLQKFDNQPEYIFDLINKVKQVKNHDLINSFDNVFQVVEKYYNENRKFPDMEWLRLRFMDVREIIEYPNPFSMQIYESFLRFVEQEIIRQKLAQRIVGVRDPKPEDMRSIANEMNRFVDHSVCMDEATKDSIINAYERYNESFDGVKTYIKAVDDAIGVLGYQSLSVFAAPSGHGKSTFAFSVALNNALHGRCIDYLSFEVPKEHAWFNFVSAYSYNRKPSLNASALKCNELTEEEAKYYKIYARELLARIKEAGGWLNVIDQTMSSNANTYDGLCSMLETEAEKRGRKADLIIVDNVDNFQTLRVEGKREDEITRMNNYIINLDGFSKKYCDGAGCAILLLSQVNRPAMKKLHNANANDSKTKASGEIDVTCIQRYNALYEKATVAFISVADETAQTVGTVRAYVAKIRNKQKPLRPLLLKVDFEHSLFVPEFEMDKNYKSQEEYDKNARNLFDPSRKADFETEDIPVDKPPIMDDIDEINSFNDLLNG